jgi:hypothetical protein
MALGIMGTPCSRIFNEPMKQWGITSEDEEPCMSKKTFQLLACLGLYFIGAISTAQAAPLSYVPYCSELYSKCAGPLGSSPNCKVYSDLNNYASAEVYLKQGKSLGSNLTEVQKTLSTLLTDAERACRTYDQTGGPCQGGSASAHGNKLCQS